MRAEEDDIAATVERWVVPARQGLRPEIQALRAVAVMAVVLYHLWPDRLPGGYAGVDVFFVISGFLITAHLLREVERDGRVRLAAFWARRARRLLPAALLVVVVSAVGTLAFVPQTFWTSFFAEMGGAIFYVVNWQLAFNAVDYLAAENNASPVQHYWSLSAEEQFYILWPLLIVLALWIAIRWGAKRRTAILATLSVVTAASLVFSVALTATTPNLAYFITPTRAWEFGIGGLLAFVPAIGPAVLRVVIAWAGVAGIALTALAYTADTPFPGWQALLPVVSTAAVIWAGTTTERGSFAQLARFRPVHYLGDISYSVYLWHWPPIVILPYALAQDHLLLTDKLAILAGTVLVAALSKRFVEDPVRSAGVWARRRPGYSLRWAAVAMVVAVVVPAAGYGVAQRANQIAAEEIAALDLDGECVGAGALLDPQCADKEPAPASELVPDLAALKEDVADAYECYEPAPEEGEPMRCATGSDDDDALRVALTGDSHAAMMIPGLESYLSERNWRLTTFVGRGCTWAYSDANDECQTYREKLSEQLKEFDVVITTARRPMPGDAEHFDRIAQERAAAWKDAIDAGVTVIAVADNPMLPEDQVDCVIENPEKAAAGEACVQPTKIASTPEDPMFAATDLEPRAHLIDLRDAYCTEDGCPMVAGGVVVYRDQHHLTATYAQSVTPLLISRIDRALAEDG